MASSVLDVIEVITSKAYRLRNTYAGRAWEPAVPEFPAFPEAPDSVPESSAENGSYVKGFFVAIALETAMALGGYGIWRVWHLLR
jgi:hypothetical protein